MRAFVNTLDREDGVDVLDRGWLADNGLVPRGEEVGSGELERLRDLREAIRDLLLANNGVDVDGARAIATLDAAAIRTRLGVRFRATGTVSLEPDPAGGERATASILAAVAALLGTEAWSRLKACRWDACRWAFADESRNRSRAWCSMEACGNRAKARAFRARH